MRAGLILHITRIVCLVHAAEVKVHRFIDKLLGDGELEDSEVNKGTSVAVLAETHAMVGFGSHCSCSVSFYDANLQVHGFVRFCCNLELWLLKHNLEEAFHPRSELNYVVCIVVHGENISDMEVSRHKLFVVLYLI